MANEGPLLDIIPTKNEDAHLRQSSMKRMENFITGTLKPGGGKTGAEKMKF